MSESELSRVVKVKALADEPYVIEADKNQRAALAKRFDLSTLHSLKAELSLTPDKSDILADGSLIAEWAQPCAVSGEDFTTSVNEKLSFRFVPPHEEVPEEELELDAEDCDEIPFEGDSFDLGEAVAQSFGLLIDPYATGPDADRVRKEKGIRLEGEQNGPMAEMLAALKKD